MPRMIYPTPEHKAHIKIPVGVSACLMGDNVRFNGGHARSSYCCGPLQEYFEYQKFCPEVSAGFGIPRPTLRLIGDPDSPKLVYSDRQDLDVTTQLTEACTPFLENVAALDGYILMKNSPSCGMSRIKVYQPNGHPHMERTSGLFAAAIMERYPNLPVEEDGRLNDAALRENFVLRVFAHYRFRHEVEEKPSYSALLDFHSHYKYVLMAHCQQEYRALGTLLGTSRHASLDGLKTEYFNRFMSAICKPADRKNHCNVLLHLTGYLKRSLSSEARQDILTVIEQYRRNEVNLATPVTLLYHYLRQHGSDYVKAQRYLEPYPAALGLRNTV